MDSRNDVKSENFTTKNNDFLNNPLITNGNSRRREI